MGSGEEDAAGGGDRDARGRVEFGGCRKGTVAGEALNTVASEGGDGAAGDLAQAVVGAVADEQSATVVQRKSNWLVQSGRSGWSAVAGEARAAVANECGDDAVAYGADALVAGICDIDCAVRAECDRLRRVEFGADRWAAIAGEALHAAAGDHQPCAAERGLKDLVTGGVGDVEIAGNVIGDAGWCEQRRRGLGSKPSGGAEHEESETGFDATRTRAIRRQESPSTLREVARHGFVAHDNVRRNETRTGNKKRTQRAQTTGLSTSAQDHPMRAKTARWGPRRAPPV